MGAGAVSQEGSSTTWEYPETKHIGGSVHENLGTVYQYLQDGWAQVLASSAQDHLSKEIQGDCGLLEVTER